MDEHQAVRDEAGESSCLLPAARKDEEEDEPCPGKRKQNEADGRPEPPAQGALRRREPFGGAGAGSLSLDLAVPWGRGGDELG